jgi:hypothetical protein
VGCAVGAKPSAAQPHTAAAGAAPINRQASKAFTDNKEDLLQLWCHEVGRVFGDRMWDASDRAWLRRALDERLAAGFGTSTAAMFEATDGEVRARWCQWWPLACCVLGYNLLDSKKWPARRRALDAT